MLKKTEEMTEDREERTAKRKKVLAGVLCYVLPLLFCVAASFLYPIPMYEKIRTIVLVTMLLMVLLFAEKRSGITKAYLYDNGARTERFYMAFWILFAIACFFPMFSKMGWPLLFFAVVLTMFSECIMGMVSYVAILSFTCMVGQVDFYTFLFYFISGVCAIVLFSVIDERFKIEIPLTLSLLCFVASLCANVVITQNANLSLQMLIVPFISLFLNAILIIMFLWYVNVSIISREKSRYQEINDPEYELMNKMKEAGKEHYFHAIHTAYLCNRIATKLSMDTDAIRAAGFYRSAGIVMGEDNMQNLMAVCKEYEFPDKVCAVLKEYKAGGRLKTKEAAVVTMSGAVIDSIMYLFAQNAKANIQYSEVIGAIFSKKMQKGIFDQCDITMYEMNQMKKILMEEKLYYDFLR